MKNLFLLLFCVLFSITMFGQGAGKLTMSPEHPMPGETITITYEVGDSPLKDAAVFDAIVYLSNEDKFRAEQFELKKVGQHYTGEVQTKSNDQLISFYFEEFDTDNKDDNNKKGYISMLYKEDRSTPVQGAYYQMGKCFAGRALGYSVDRDWDKCIAHFQKEFAAYPSSKNNLDLLSNYNFYASRAKNEGAKADLLSIANQLKKEKKSEDKLWTAYTIFETQGSETDQEELGALLKQKYPKGELAKKEAMDALNEAFKAKDFALAEAKYAAYVGLLDLDNKEDVDDKNFYAIITGYRMINSGGDPEKIKEFYEKGKGYTEST
ncbi:MAG: hypothetical protein AAF705_17260, partial [Bacteroidota bacterium]